MVQAIAIVIRELAKDFIPLLRVESIQKFTLASLDR